jgi:hypothetical protein
MWWGEGYMNIWQSSLDGDRCRETYGELHLARKVSTLSL